MFIFTREELGQEEEIPKEVTPDLGFTSPTYYREDGTEVKAKDAKYLFQERPTIGEFTGKMFGAGVDQVQGLGMGVVGLAGDLAGVESVKKLGLEGFNDNMREAAMAREEAGMVDFTDIEGVGDAAKWAYGTLLEQAPQLIPTIALGGAGGLAGKQFAKGVVQSAVQKAVANGLTEKAAAVSVANAVSSRGGLKLAAQQLVKDGVAKETAEGALGAAATEIAAARIAPIAGAAAGNLATGVGMEAGSIYGETEDAGLALKYGIPAGAIEGFTDTLIGSPFIRRAFGVNVAKNTAEGSMLKEIGKGVAKGVALEGPAEELPQTYLEQMARAEDDPNFDINSEEAKRERLNAMAAGSLVGSAVGGAGGVVERLAPVTANALKGLVQKPLEDPEVPDAGAAAPSGDIVYDKDSVTLDGGLVMRRWNIEETGANGWVVENAQQDVFDKLANARSGIVQDGKLFVFPNTQEGASLFDRAETAAAKARGEIVDEDGDGIPDDQEKTDDSDLESLDLSGNESVIQATKQKETKKAVVEAGIPADAADDLIEDLRNSGVDEENIVETAKATAATLPAKKQSQIPPPPAPILTDSTPVEEIDREIASRRDLLETTTFGAEGDAALQSSIEQLEQAKTAKVEPKKTPQVSDETTTQPEDAGSIPAPATPAPVSVAEEEAAPVSEIAELNEEDSVVDEDEYEEDSEDEEPEPNAVDTKLEQLQAEHKAKIEADKEEQRKILESRTQEQQQAIVDSFTPGQVISNGVTTGAFVEKTGDGGIVVAASNGKKQKMSPATVQNVTTATAIDPEPTQEKAKIAVLEETNDLGAAGFKPTGEADEDGGQILEDKRKDGLGKPFTVSTKLFKKKDGTTVSRSSFTYAPKNVEPKNLKRTRQAEKLNVLRVMNQGVEVRVPNSVPAPAWMTVRPVEGKDYSVVVTAEYEENGANVGRFNATDRQGSFEDAYKNNQAIRNIKVDASNQNRESREEAGTSATAKAAKRIQGASPLVEMLFSVISKPWFKSVESQIASDSLSGLGLQGQDEYRKIASNKIQNALSKISLEPKKKKGAEKVEGAAGLVAKTAELFVSGEDASQIPKLVLEGRKQNTEETKLVNRTVTALGELSIFALPSKHVAALEQVKTEALKYASLRPNDVSVDAKNEDGEDTQGDSLTASQLIQDSKQGKKGASKITLAAPSKLSGEELETMVEADKMAKAAIESGFLEKLEELKKSFTKLELLALDYLNAPDTKSQYELKRTVEEQLLFLRDRRTFRQLLASVERRAAELAEKVSGVKVDEAIPRRPAPKSRVAVSAENIAAAQEQAKQLSFEDRRSVLISEELSEDQIDALSDDEVERQVVQIFALNNAARAAEAPKAETKTSEPKKSKTVYDQETKTFKAVSATATPVVEVAEQVALTPDEKFADDYLNEPDAEKQQSMLDAFEKPRIEEAQAKMVERGIDQPTATKIAGNKVKQKTTELISAAYRRRSPQSPGTKGAKGTKGPQGAKGTAPGRKPSSPKLQRIKRRFLQAKVGLSDEQMVGMSNAEVDRAYLAYNSQADENKAATAQDAVVSVAPGIERLVELGDQELVGAYADAILTAEKEGDYGKLRDLNFNELVRFGAFDSTRELLTRLADPKNKAPRDMQVRAKAFLDMEKRGLKLDNIEVQAANFLKTGTKDRAVWGGLLGRNADYSAFGVYINLDQAHDRETPLQTVLHELAHVATFAKVHGKVKTTAQEDRIIKDLERMRRAAILKAGNASPAMKVAADKAGATTPEARLANYEKALKTMIGSGEEGSRRYNGLQNLDEFIVEMTGSPDFVQLLSQLGFGAVNADKRTFNGMIRDAFNAILKLIGVNINPSSELGKAFMDSWNFTFRGTKYKAAPSELLKSVRGVAEEAKAEPKAKAAKAKATKAAPQGKAAETETQTNAAAPQGEAPTTQVNAETKEKPESNNQATEQPNPENAEVPQTGGTGEGSGAAVEKPKRGRGRPRNSESRNRTALPTTNEEVEETLSNSQEAFNLEIGPQSPAAKPRIVRASVSANDSQDQADLRASNMEDILFYSGIDEGDYNALINKGILTPKEIEAGYMQDVPKMLSNIAGDDTVVDGQPIIPAPLRHVAQMLLDLGFDFSKVRFRTVEGFETKAEGGWAGLYRAGTSARSGEISINMDASHEGGIAQTIVHEALHHVFFWKTQKGYPLNRVERTAFRDLEKIFKQAERLALGRYTGRGQTLGQAKARLAPGDLFYGLTNLDEFITEILTNPKFQIFLQQAAPMQGLPKKGGYIRNLLDQIFAYFKDFIYGRDVSGDSLLTQGLDNVLAFIQTPQTEAGVQRAFNELVSAPTPRATMPAAPMSPAGLPPIKYIERGERSVPSGLPSGSTIANRWSLQNLPPRLTKQDVYERFRSDYPAPRYTVLRTSQVNDGEEVEYLEAWDTGLRSARDLVANLQSRDQSRSDLVRGLKNSLSVYLSETEARKLVEYGVTDLQTLGYEIEAKTLAAIIGRRAPSEEQRRADLGDIDSTDAALDRLVGAGYRIKRSVDTEGTTFFTIRDRDGDYVGVLQDDSLYDARTDVVRIAAGVPIENSLPDVESAQSLITDARVVLGALELPALPDLNWSGGTETLDFRPAGEAISNLRNELGLAPIKRPRFRASETKPEEAGRGYNAFVAKVWSALRTQDIFKYGPPLKFSGNAEDFEGGDAVEQAETHKAVVNKIAKTINPPGMVVEAKYEFAPKYGESIVFNAVNSNTGEKIGSIRLSHDDQAENTYGVGATGANSKGKEDGGGSALYQAAYDYVYAVGGKVKGSSLSDINTIRRTSNMLASALRHGTTKHLISNTAQNLFGYVNSPQYATPELQKALDDQNLMVLAQREMENVFEFAPNEVQGWKYDFETGRFVDSNREDIARERFESAVRLGDPEKSGIGLATLQRAVITHTALQESGGGESQSRVLELSSRVQPLNQVAYSPAGDAMKMIAKLTGSETKTTFNGGTYTAGGALSPDGKLDKQAGDKWRQSRAQITAAARRIDTLSTRLVSAVKAAKKSGVEVSTETMNTALGNLDNPLTQAQRSEVRRMREIDEEEGNTMEAAYLAKNREAFKVKQRAALAALPSNVAEALSEMNEHIAHYSAMLKDSGILDSSMAATVDANLGIYLHRSYEIFDNE